MRINEYKQKLKGLDDADLDKSLLMQPGGELALEHPTAELPANFANFVGAVITPKAGRPAPDRAAVLQRTGNAPSPSEGFFINFLNDMERTYGRRITSACLDACYPDHGKPLTARQVKQIIQNASEQWGKKQFEDQVRHDNQRENDHSFALFLDSDSREFQRWFLSIPVPNPHRQPMTSEVEMRVVKKMTIALCQQLPAYSQQRISDEMMMSVFTKVIDQMSVFASRSLFCANTKALWWSGLEHRLNERGVKHLLTLLPVYSCGLLYIKRSSMCRMLVSTAYRHNLMGKWSESFCSSIGPHCQKTFFSDIDEERLLQCAGEDAMIPLIVDQLIERFIQILGNQNVQIKALENASQLTFGQRVLLTRVLESEPCSPELFSGFLNCAPGMTSCLQGAVNSQDESELFAVMRTMSAIIDDVAPDSVTDDQLAVILDMGLTGLTPVEARALLARVRAFEETMQAMLNQAEPSLKNVYERFVERLEQRSRQAGDKFQDRCQTRMSMLDAGDTHGNPLETALLRPKLAEDSNRNQSEVIRQLLSSELVLIDADGKPVIDLETLSGLKGEERLGYFSACLGPVMNIDEGWHNVEPLGRLAKALVTASEALGWGFSGAARMGEKVSGMLSLEDNTPLSVVIVGDPQVAQCTFSRPVDGCLDFTFRKPWQVESALSGDSQFYWLQTKASYFGFEADVRLFADGSARLREPARCNARLVVSQWPGTRFSSPPKAADWSNEAERRMSEHQTMHESIRRFAESRGNVNAISILDTLNAIRLFDQQSTSQGWKAADAFYDGFIKPITLGSASGKVRKALAEIIEEFNAGKDIDTAQAALDELLEKMQPLMALPIFVGSSFRATVDELEALYQSFQHNTAAENRAGLTRVLTELKAPNSSLARLIKLVPQEVRERLVTAFSQYQIPLDSSTFNPLAVALGEILEEEFLPEFIESVIAESMGKTRAT